MTTASMSSQVGHSIDSGDSFTTEENGDNVESAGEGQDNVPSVGFFDGFNPWKLVAAGAVGCAVGLGYSVLDQTILHKPKKSDLPYTSDLLQSHMPDVLERAEKFYAHRRLVRTKRGKQEFDRFAREMLKQSEYFAAIYATMMQVHAKNGGITPDGLQKHFS